MLGKHLLGKQFALYTHSLTKVPETEEAGVGLVGMGRETKGWFCFSPIKRMV